MSGGDGVEKFGTIAQGLAKNPLGIIALFIVLVYGFASMVMAFGSDLSIPERMPLVYFLVAFPVLVLAVFTWLVIAHHAKLFGPGDYKNEENFIKTMTAAASLSAASAKSGSNASDTDTSRIVDLVREAARSSEASFAKDHILWVDDNPDSILYERRAFEAIGFRFTLALTTDEALIELAKGQFAAVISDMGRKAGPREGYVLLDKMRVKGDQTPLFFYSTSNSPEHIAETLEHGGQGCVNTPEDLFQSVTRTVIRQRAT